MVPDSNPGAQVGPTRVEGDERSENGTELSPPWAFRSNDFGRIFSLSDGVFAFSMTLLVLGLALPASAEGSALASYLASSKFFSALYAYVITFFIISLWWRTHSLQFSYIRSHTRRLGQFNTAFLIFIAILPFATQVLGASGSSPVGVIFFATIQVACGVTLAALWLYAAGPGRLTDPRLPKSWERYLTLSTVAVPLVFGLSIPIALVSVQYAPIVWVGALIIPLHLRRSVQRGP
jgi:uncharacterized membrane protein